MNKTLNFLFIILFIIVLAYLASPDREYTDKLWVLKGVSLAQPYKAAVIEYIQRTGELPGAGDIEQEKIFVRVDFANTAVETITIGEDKPGLVTVHYSTNGIDSAPVEIDKQKIILSPTLSGNKLSWSCSGTMPVQFIPVICN